MKSVVLVSALLLPVISLAHDPSPLLADDGRDLSFLLNRYDGPTPILQRTVKGKRHIVPRTLQVEEVPVRRALNGLVERQSCVPGYLPCPGSLQCCPVATICGPGSCCPIGSLPCIAGCKISRSFAFLVCSHISRSSGCPDLYGDCCTNLICCPAGQVGACFLLTACQTSDSVSHRPASLRLMDKLGAALVVKPVLPSLVSEPGKHHFVSLLNLDPPRMRGLYSCAVHWRLLLLSSWYHLWPRYSRQGELFQYQYCQYQYWW